jgi:hypothetical protein
LSDRETDQTDERSSVHTKSDFAGIARVQEIGDALARTSNRRVDFLAFQVTPTALDVTLEEMMIDGIQDGLWNLRARGVVEEGERRSSMQGRKQGANGLNRKIQIWLRVDFLPEDTLRFGLQAIAPGQNRKSGNGRLVN